MFQIWVTGLNDQVALYFLYTWWQQESESTLLLDLTNPLLTDFILYLPTIKNGF